MESRRHLLLQRRGWDRSAADYERYWRRQLAPAHRAVLRRADLASGERVVDVACGTGLVTLAAAAAVAPGRVTACDLAPAMVAATQLAAQRGGFDNVEGTACGAEALTLEGPFDVALCSLGLMYVPDPAAAVAEMVRVLRPGGRLVVSTWGPRQRCGWAELFGIVDARVTSDVCPRFFALGDHDVLVGVLDRAGLVDIGEERLTVTLDYDDDEAAIGAAFLGGPVALAYARFDQPTRASAARDYLDSLAGYRLEDGRYRVPGEFVVAWARRP